MARFQKRGDQEAFGRLVSSFASPGLAVARQILADRALAEDAVQETFLRVVRGRDRYAPARAFSTWFYTILRRVCVDMLRRRARLAEALRRVPARSEPIAERPGEHPGEAEGLIASLPEGEREVLKLRILGELSFRDVAAALGISEEAAKKRAQRGLRRLRRRAQRTAGRPRLPAPV